MQKRCLPVVLPGEKQKWKAGASKSGKVFLEEMDVVGRHDTLDSNGL